MAESDIRQARGAEPDSAAAELTELKSRLLELSKDVRKKERLLSVAERRREQAEQERDQLVEQVAELEADLEAARAEAGQHARSAQRELDRARAGADSASAGELRSLRGQIEELKLQLADALREKEQAVAHRTSDAARHREERNRLEAELEGTRAGSSEGARAAEEREHKVAQAQAAARLRIAELEQLVQEAALQVGSLSSELDSAQAPKRELGARELTGRLSRLEAELEVKTEQAKSLEDLVVEVNEELARAGEREADLRAILAGQNLLSSETDLQPLDPVEAEALEAARVTGELPADLFPGGPPVPEKEPPPVLDPLGAMPSDPHRTQLLAILSGEGTVDDSSDLEWSSPSHSEAPRRRRSDADDVRPGHNETVALSREDLAAHLEGSMPIERAVPRSDQTVAFGGGPFVTAPFPAATPERIPPRETPPPAEATRTLGRGGQEKEKERKHEPAPEPPPRRGQTARPAAPDLTGTLGPDELSQDKFSSLLRAGATIVRTERFGKIELVNRIDIQVAEWVREALTFPHLQDISGGRMHVDKLLEVMWVFFQRKMFRLRSV